MTEELRTRAVQAMILRAAHPIFDDGHTDTYYGTLLAAAEPFIRELVVAQVVEWLRANADNDDLGGMLRGTANSILREFGGSR